MHVPSPALSEIRGEQVFLTCFGLFDMIMRAEHESVCTVKDTETTLCAEKVELQVSGAVPLGAIVYCD